MTEKKITLPLKDDDIASLRAGDNVLLSGTLLTARDAAHKRLYKLMKNKESLPVNIKGETFYYVGPSDAPPGHTVGSAGPTSSYRMDTYTPDFLDYGLKGMIGKGDRSPEVVKAIVRNKAVYFMAVGGAGAILSKSIVKQELICYENLQTEAIRRYTLKDFPVIVAIDSYGNNIYKRQQEETYGR